MSVFASVLQHTNHTRNDVVEALNAAIESHDEGIVVKRPDSHYKLNTRNKNDGWLKIKPDYVSEVTEDDDVLIVGGYFGSTGKNLLSHFLVALIDELPPGADEGAQRTFTALAKVGSGYTMQVAA